MTNSNGSSEITILQPRKGPRSSRRNATNYIEIANKKSDDEFISEYLPSIGQNWSEWVHPKDPAKRYTLGLVGAGRLGDEDLDVCFHLINQTSGEDYRKSSAGWHPAVKKKEMRSPDLRYIIVKNDDRAISGFTSMMPTFENGEPVVYCYEIHLKPELQGTGLGRQLMGYLLEAGDNIQSVEKVMLTCFVCNDKARTFYDKLGFGVDEFSPRERKLRGGKTVVPDYLIMSRRTRTIMPQKGKQNDATSQRAED